MKGITVSKECDTPPGQTAGLANIESVGTGYVREYAQKTTRTQAEKTPVPIIIDEDWEGALESDRRFFRRFRKRNYYIRPASRSEIEMLGEPPLPPGRMWFAVVRQLVPGFRVRRWCAGHQDLIFDEACESTAKHIWESLGGDA